MFLPFSPKNHEINTIQIKKFPLQLPYAKRVAAAAVPYTAMAMEDTVEVMVVSADGEGDMGDMAADGEVVSAGGEGTDDG